MTTRRTHWTRRGRIALASALLGATLGGCVIAADSRPARGAAPEAGGATYCAGSSDGHAVACGGSATFCQQSADGRRVACGGLATFCQKSSSGEDVACGGKASYCETSADGKKVACGGDTRAR